MSILAKLGDRISTKRKFVQIATVSLGIPCAVVGILALAKYGLGIVVLVLVVAFAGSYVWSLVMWRLYFQDLFGENTRRGQADASAGDPPR
jgi:hypothetical protein